MGGELGEEVIVAVDPDTVNPGVACFATNGVLVQAFAAGVDSAVTHVDGWLYPRGAPTQLVIEMPQMYGRQGDQRDFLRLATVVGRFQQAALARGARVELVPPKKWKGEVPKGVCSLRIWRALNEWERRVATSIPDAARRKLEAGRGVASGEGSDVIDAIGIGLWKLGRLHARRQ